MALRLRPGDWPWPDGFYPRPCAGRDAAAEVAVAAQIFGAAVDHDIDAKGDGRLVDRGGEGVVDNGGDTSFPGQGCDLSDVDDLQQRVGGRLDHYRPGFRGYGLDDCGRIGGDEGVVNPQPAKSLGRQGVGAAIEGLEQYHVFTACDRAEDGRADGGHAGRKEHRLFRQFECRHLLFDRLLVGGVEMPGVETVGRVAIVKGGGGENRRIHAAGAGVMVGAAVDTEGIFLQEVSPISSLSSRRVKE